jgi:hypothetical protein
VTSTADTGSSQKTVRVAVAVPLDRTFDYNYEGPVLMARYLMARYLMAR